VRGKDADAHPTPVDFVTYVLASQDATQENNSAGTAELTATSPSAHHTRTQQGDQDRCGNQEHIEWLEHELCTNKSQLEAAQRRNDELQAQLTLARRELREAERSKWDALLHHQGRFECCPSAGVEGSSIELQRLQEEAKHWMNQAALREQEAIKARTEVNRLQRTLAAHKRSDEKEENLAVGSSCAKCSAHATQAQPDAILMAENEKLKKQIAYLQKLMIQTARQAPEHPNVN
jgi:bacterioferritin-associated ferredoxin